VSLTTFVDDAPIFSKGSYEHVYTSVVDGALDFHNASKRLGLKQSPKSLVTASSSSLARSISRSLKKSGVVFQPAPFGRDLGISFSPGNAKLNKKVMKDRKLKTKPRLSRIASLAKQFRAARKLYNASGFAASTWGHQSCGFSDRELLQTERQAAQCTGIKAAGRCRFTALHISYGPRGHPVGRIIKELFQYWFKVFAFYVSGPPSQYLELRLAWSKVKQEFRAAGKVTGKLVKGLISNVIATLLKLGWEPVTVDLWNDPQGNEWKFKSPDFPSHLIVHALVDSYNKQSLVRAAEHYNGAGQADGLDFNTTLAYNYSLKTSKKFAHLAALETVQAAACWGNARVHEIHPEVSPLCSRCGLEPETDLHTFWTCPCNANLEDEEVVSTQKHIPRAVAEAETFPCFWLRGLCPEKFTQPPNPPPPPSKRVFKFESVVPPKGQWPSGVYYGDGGGGGQTSYPTLRRCAVGLCNVQESVFCFGIHYALPGDIQTVPRSELSAAATLVEMLANDTVVLFITDNKPFCDTFHNGKEAAKSNSNADLYNILFQNIESKNITLRVRWMPSHLDEHPEKEKPEWVTEHDICGNDHADRLVKASSRVADLSMDQVSRPIWNIHLTKAIQKRFICILMSLPARRQPFRPPQVPRQRPDKPSLENILSRTQHELFLNQHGQYVCIHCKSMHNFKAKSFQQWALSPCIPCKIQHFQATTLASQVRVGNNITHASHSMSSYRGLLHCIRCGSIATTKLHLLSKECPGKPNSNYGVRNKKYIQRGALPPGVDMWPEDNPGFFELEFSQAQFTSAESVAFSQLQQQVSDLSQRMRPSQPPASSSHVPGIVEDSESD